VKKDLKRSRRSGFARMFTPVRLELRSVRRLQFEIAYLSLVFVFWGVLAVGGVFAVILHGNGPYGNDGLFFGVIWVALAVLGWRIWLRVKLVKRFRSKP
jgi:hypothetical protein